MSNHYFNKIKKSACVMPTIDDDFFIYTITRRDVSQPFDLTSFLREYSNQIVAVKYAGTTIYVMVDKNSKLNDSIMRNILPSEDIIGVDSVRAQHLDTCTILNLLLYGYASKKFDCNGSEINGKYVVSVKSTKDEIIGIACQFNGSNGDIRLDANVNTFSKYHLLTEKDQKKCKGLFLSKNGTMIKKASSLPTDENAFALKQRFNGKKNSWDSYHLTTPSGNSKIDIIGDIYTYFKGSKYISGFDFESTEMIKYEDHKYFDKIVKKYREFYQGKQINVICPDDFDFSIFSHRQFDFIKAINKVSEPADGLNLILMKFTENGENKAADEIYERNRKSEFVCQHINVSKIKDKETLSSEIITALRELIIKYELHMGQITSFDWSKYANSPTSELIFCKKTINADDDDVYYAIKVNIHTGKIDAFVDDDPDFLGDAIYYMDESDIGTIVSDSGEKITLRKSAYHIVPYYREYQDEIGKYLDGKNLVVNGGDLYDKLLSIVDSRKDLSEPIQSLLRIPEVSRYVFENSDEDVQIFDIKKIIQKNIPKARVLSEALDAWVREEYNSAIVNHIKGQKETIFLGLVGLHYNNEWFTVAESENSIKDQSRNIKINQIEYHEQTDPSFFKEILPLFYVPFVRNNMLSAKPFPFKYLDEWIKLETIRSNGNKT